MFINYEMATIEITKAEAKEAGVFKYEMYENLKEAREATGYKVVVKDTKRKADTMKGLTCSSFLDVACIALDNEHFFPEGNTVSLLLEDVNNRINSCIEELEKMKGTDKK